MLLLLLLLAVERIQEDFVEYVATSSLTLTAFLCRWRRRRRDEIYVFHAFINLSSTRLSVFALFRGSVSHFLRIPAVELPPPVAEAARATRHDSL